MRMRGRTEICWGVLFLDAGTSVKEVKMREMEGPSKTEIDTRDTP